MQEFSVQVPITPSGIAGITFLMAMRAVLDALEVILRMEARQAHLERRCGCYPEEG